MSDVEIVRSVYEAMAARDLERLSQLIHPDCVITQDPALPWGGRHVGHEGFASFAGALLGAIDSNVTTEALFAAGDEVIQFGHTRGRCARTARRSTSRRCIAGRSATVR